MKKIAVAAPINHEHPDQFFEGDYFSKVAAIALENKDLSFSIVDVYSLTDKGLLTSTDPMTQQSRTVDIREFDLMHFLELERYLDRDITFRDKWQQVYTMLDTLEKFSLKCINSTDAIRYCSDKTYLLDLQSAGISIIGTELIEASSSLPDLQKKYGTHPTVIKPIRGECGRFVFLLQQVGQRGYQQLTRQDDVFLLQPFREEIRQGEISLLFFDDQLSHAFHRVSSLPSFKKEEPRFPGKSFVHAYTPSAPELEFGLQVYRAFKQPLNIYRVDFLSSSSGYELMEVESVDPYHYPQLNPSYAATIGNFYRKHLS